MSHHLTPAQLNQRSLAGKSAWCKTVKRFIELHYPDLDMAARALTGHMRGTGRYKFTKAITTRYMERWAKEFGYGNEPTDTTTL
jgi:hypothetical protein